MAAMYNAYKTKNQIFKDFIGFANNALTAFNISDWIVKRLYQNIKCVDVNSYILIQITNKKQLGSEYRSLLKTETNQTTNYLREYNAKQEVTIRFSATKRDKNSETVETLDSIDVLEILKNYLQSYEGIDALAKLGYAQYRATDIKQLNFENDDDNVQFLPFFECTYLYTNNWQSQVNHISKVIEKDKYTI